MVAPERPGHDRPWRVLFVNAEPIWDDTLPTGLRELGHDVAIVPHIGAHALSAAIAAHRPDFALTVGWGTLHGPDNLDLLRRMLGAAGVPHVYWDVESANNLERWVLPYVRRVRPDLVCTISGESISAIEAQGVPARYLTFGCNPRIHRVVAPRPEFACDFALVATAWNCWNDDRGHALRHMLAPLLEQPVRVGIWGQMWEDLPAEAGFRVPAALLRGPIAHDRAAEVYASAKAVLGPQNEFQTGTQLTMRTVEILACGAALLTSRTPAVTRVFEPGRHLLTTRSATETLILARWLLDHPDRRREIGEQGRQEALARHTYRHRAAELLTQVESTLPAFGGTAWPMDRRAPWYGELPVAGGAGGQWRAVPLTVTVPTARLPESLRVERARLCLLGAAGQGRIAVQHHGATLDVVDRTGGVRERWCEWDVTSAVVAAHRVGAAELSLTVVAEAPAAEAPAFRWNGWTMPGAARPYVWIAGAQAVQGAGRPQAGH